MVGLTHGAEVDSDCRQCPPTADLSFYISRTPPFRLSFHLCVSRCTGAFPVGSSVERGSSEWSHAQGARVVLRGFVVLPLFAQGQHYVFYLSFTTGGGGSVSLITLPGHVPGAPRSRVGHRAGRAPRPRLAPMLAPGSLARWCLRARSGGARRRRLGSAYRTPIGGPSTRGANRYTASGVVAR